MNRIKHCISFSKICIFVPIVLMLTVMICSSTRTSTNADTRKIPEHLKIIAIGTSFSFNTLYYVYDIAEELGIEDVTIGNLYIGSCSLKKHWNNAKNDKKAYRYYKNTDGKWTSTKNVSISEALADENWDYVMFLQYSGDAGKISSYKVLDNLLDHVRDRVGNETKFLWNMVWAFQSDYSSKRFAEYDYDQALMYKRIVSATKKKILTNEKISYVIASGAAIQKARTSLFGDTFTLDGRHLTKEARYIVGLTLISKILDISPSEIKYQPDFISAKMRKVAIKSAKYALSKF